LGIPAIFISISVPPPEAGLDFTRNVMRFALPASLSLAAAAVVVHLMVDGFFDQDAAEARTLVSLTIGITGLFYMVEVLGFQGASWRSITRPFLTSVLGIILVLGFIVAIYTDFLREFFDFTPMGAGDWFIVGSAVAAALAGQYAFSRYWQQILDAVVAKPGPADQLRGRAV
ncbi:MAG: hypothetical protein FJ317_09340, partial [SAR202 cluster bacterium]|nr:hypothetical protein [SAR202 cluster bacterium]